MNGRVSRKIRQAMRRGWREYYKDIMTQPFGVRLRIAFYIVTHGQKSANDRKV